MSFVQAKYVVDESMLKTEEESDDETAEEAVVKEGEVRKIRFNPEHHIMLEEARKIKKNAKAGDEITFPLETKRKFRNDSGANRQTSHHPENKRSGKRINLRRIQKRQGEIISGIVQKNGGWQCVRGLRKSHSHSSPRGTDTRREVSNGRKDQGFAFLGGRNPPGDKLVFVLFPSEVHRQLFELEIPEIANGAVEIKTSPEKPVPGQR